MKPEKKVEVIAKKEITIGDITVLEGPKKIIDEIYKIKIMEIYKNKDKNYLIASIEIVKHIQQYCDDIIVYNLGEKDTIVSYKKQFEKENKLLTLVKIAFVGITLICGGAFAIMTFHTDAAVPDVFVEFYYIFMGNRDMQPYALEIPYSIGLAVGIIVFFNHFSKIKLTDDPTPIEVEMRMYEKNVEDSIIEALIDEKEQE